MTLSTDTLYRLRYALANPRAADELNQQLGFSAGTTYYVDSTSAYDGDSATKAGTSPDEPFSTLDYAIGRCTASKGDTIVVMPGHVETTTAIALDVAGVRIVGLGYGRNRPTFTATTAATDLINITAANCWIENIRLVGAASGCTALLDIAAADATIKNVVFEHGAAPLTAVTVVSMSHRFLLEDCQWLGTAAGPDFSIKVEGPLVASDTTNDWHIIRPRAFYASSAGLDDAFLQVNISCQGYSIEYPVVVGIDTLFLDINSSTAALGDGLCVGARVSAYAALTIANVNDVGGCSPLDNQYTDSLTASGAKIPATTAS